MPQKTPLLRDYPTVLRAVQCLYACNNMPVNAHDSAVVPSKWRTPFMRADAVTLSEDELYLVCDGEDEERKAWVKRGGANARALDAVLAAAFEGTIWK